LRNAETVVGCTAACEIVVYGFEADAAGFATIVIIPRPPTGL
jgi:hypothetical protein